MSTSLKKLLLISITLLLGVTSSRAMADTNYDFNYSGNSGSGSVTGVFVVNDVTNLITDISGTVSGFGGVYTAPITRLIAPGGLHDNDNQYFPSVSGPYLSNDGVTFDAGGRKFNLSYGYSEYYLVTVNIGSSGSMTSSISGGAPEMNASLIPQVGLLLGCLFFLFGRKREVVEPLLPA